MKKFFLLGALVALMFGSSGPVFSQSHTVGRDATWFPLQLEAKTPALTAFINALVAEISRITHYRIEIVDIDWVQIFQNLEEGHVGGIFTPLTPELLSEKKYSFSDPVVQLGPVLIVPTSSRATSLLDLSGKTVAIYQFDESILVAQKFPSVMIELYQNMGSILEDLKAGRVDGVLMPVLDAQALVNNLYLDQLHIVSAPLNEKAIRLVTCRKKYRSLLNHFNRGLKKVRANGTYDKLRARYII